MLDRYFSLQYNITPTDDGRDLPVSRAGNVKWITIPWNTIITDPEDQVYLGGWTLLYGGETGCHFSVTAHVRVQGLIPNCSTHIRLYEVDGTETRTLDRSAMERPVMPLETSNSHLDGCWAGFLSPGRRLRCEVDYWGLLAPDGSKGNIVFAGVNGFYGRPEPAVAVPQSTFDTAVLESIGRLRADGRLV